MTTSGQFHREKITKIFSDKKNVLDIGGALRISKKSGNWYSKKNVWIEKLVTKDNYKIMDPVDTYNPDIVGDIHKMPFEDNSLEAIVCMSVLEHVENPIKASEELYRVLEKGGYCYVYVPFLFYYHAEKGYYGDFWRFTEDSLQYIFKPFSSFEIQKARGPYETWFKLSPLGRISLILKIAGFFDRLLKKENSNQTSGFYVFLIK